MSLEHCSPEFILALDFDNSKYAYSAYLSCLNAFSPEKRKSIVLNVFLNVCEHFFLALGLT